MKKKVCDSTNRRQVYKMKGASRMGIFTTIVTSRCHEFVYLFLVFGCSLQCVKLLHGLSEVLCGEVCVFFLYLFRLSNNTSKGKRIATLSFFFLCFSENLVVLV